MPDGGGEGEDALQNACGDSGEGSSCVAFEVELGLEGVVDRFDDLPQRLEEALKKRCPARGFFPVRAGCSSSTPASASAASNCLP